MPAWASCPPASDVCPPAFCGTNHTVSAFEDVRWGCAICYGMIPGGKCTGDCKVPADVSTDDNVVDDMDGGSKYVIIVCLNK